MRNLNYFNLVFGVPLGVLGLFGVIFARQFQAGIAGPRYTPTRLGRVIVGIIMICVSFGFVYAGLGSPPRLRQVDNLSMSLVEVFFITAAVAGIAGSSRALIRGALLTRWDRVKQMAFILLFAAATPVAIIDLVRRVRQLVVHPF